MSGALFRGTSINQDGRFANKEKKLLRSMKWPKEFETRIDITKVKFPFFHQK